MYQKNNPTQHNLHHRLNIVYNNTNGDAALNAWIVVEHIGSNGIKNQFSNYLQIG